MTDRVKFAGSEKFSLWGKPNESGTLGLGLDFKGSGISGGPHVAHNVPTGMNGVGGSVRVGGDTGPYAKGTATHIPTVGMTKVGGEVGYQGKSGGVSASYESTTSGHGASAALNVFKSF